MPATSLVQFNAQSFAVTLFNEKTGMRGERLMTASEFKKAKGIKGSEAKRQYSGYLELNGKGNTADFAALCTTGKILVTGNRYWDNSGKGQLSYVVADKLEKPVDKAVTAVDAGKMARFEAWEKAQAAVAPAA